MGSPDLLPFKVGQQAESRSFQPGYRSAWFRCKIKEISSRKGRIGHTLEHFDFPDEKLRWTQLYQVPQVPGKKSKDLKRVLMVRPDYPPKYNESEMPSITVSSDLAVIFDGVWKVGDLVDWWTDGCYWSGTVTGILGDDKVQIELPPPPVGEGATYEVCSQDLRPSLYWSPEFGWTVPTSKEGENSRCCARVIQPLIQGSSQNSKVHNMDEGNNGINPTSGSSLNTSFSSQVSTSSLPAADNKLKRPITGEFPKEPLSVRVPEDAKDILETDTELGKTSMSDSVSSSHIRDTPAETAGNNTVDEDPYACNGSSKKIRTGGTISLNSISSDSLEAAVMDLEELANRVKWLKGILEFGVPLSDGVRPPWKFIEHRGSTRPK